MDADKVVHPRLRAEVTPSYSPIEDYAVIGDCRTAGLVSSRGSIDWLCLPHFSAPSVFGALLDTTRGGCFAIHPMGEFRCTRRYAGQTPVLQTDFHTARGVVRLTDAVPIDEHEREATMLYPQREVLRCVEVLEGDVEIEVRYAPRPCYSHTVPRLHRCGAVGWSCVEGDRLYLLHSDIELRPTTDGSELHGRIRLRRGERRYLSLSFAYADIGVSMPLGEDARERVQTTLDWWGEWAGSCVYRGPYRDMVVRSALTLKLLTYQLSGAVVAAPTTSLPEWIGGSRNWDYRYCWLRDASLTLCSFMDLGLRAEGDAFLGWLLHATRLTRPRLQPMYDIYGETRAPERTLDDLEGYRGTRPVRIGNAAHRQLQLDVYGSVVLTAFEFVERGGVLDRDECRFLADLGRSVYELWRRPDQGIWEIRGGQRHHTYSKLMCWVALDRLLRLHERGAVQIDADRFRRQREVIAKSIEIQGYNEDLGGYSGVFGAAVPDASLLLMARYGYKDARDPRMQGTFECIERRLARGPLLYRMPPGSDGLPSPEGAFLIASFWAVDYLARRGDVEQARKRFEQLLAVANDVGLYGEEMDPDTGATLGNFPQAFSHVGLIIAALSIAGATERQRSS